MLKLPFENAQAYNAGQWLGSMSQGLCIMFFSLISFVENIYSSRVMNRNFGFLTHMLGRGMFYLLMGIYSIPVVEILNEISKADNSQGVAAGIALAGVILAFFASVLHCVVFVRQYQSPEKFVAFGGQGNVIGSQSSDPPAKV
ncbi:unnamed protein product, partial [Polarella glacialis]